MIRIDKHTWTHLSRTELRDARKVARITRINVKYLACNPAVARDLIRRVLVNGERH